VADSHAVPAADQSPTEQSPLTLVPTGSLGLPERLAGRVDAHLALFAEHLREGLLAASTAVGLEVMSELMAAEVTELPALRASTTPPAPPTGTAPSRAP